MDDSNRSTGGRFRPQAWPPLSAVSDNCLGTQHSALWPRRRVVLQLQTQIICRYSTPPARTAQAVTRRHFAIRSQRRARDIRTGLAAEPLVNIIDSSLRQFRLTVEASSKKVFINSAQRSSAFGLPFCLFCSGS